RRVFLRYPVDLPTTIQSADSDCAKRLTARVRDISFGGVNLEVDHEFSPGALLSVELPGANDQSTTQVLACVVHVRALDDAVWSMGCTFSRELSADALAAFGAARRRAPAEDPRSWQRVPCRIRATYQQIDMPQPVQHCAAVCDLSPRGVGLIVTEAIDNGTLL